MAKHRKKSAQARAVWLTIFGLIALGIIVALLLRGKDVVLFNPQGLIADQQHRLMLISILIMLGFGIPILFFLYYFAWRYREDNDKAVRSPHSTHGKSMTLVIWGLPTIIMLVLAAILIPSTHKLAPTKSLESENTPVKIQVVALRWKWLFIYPEENIATVNFIQVPVNTPIQFDLTADEAPMNSFWIPHLGGMLYAMTEHSNRLNLMADSVGDFEGSAAEISGAGFAGMRFNTRVSSQADFDTWVATTAESSTQLTADEYQKLLIPSEDNKAAFFSSPVAGLYSTILSKYGGSHQHYAEVEGQE